MKEFFRKMLFRFARFMSGRNGPDQLGMALLIASFVPQLILSFTGFRWLVFASLGLYGWFLFRFFSKNKFRRQEENRRFVSFYRGAVWKVKQFFLRVKQFFLRLKGMKRYKYFRCPQCRLLLRLNRGTGEKEIHCPGCGHDFRQKA